MFIGTHNSSSYTVNFNVKFPNTNWKWRTLRILSVCPWGRDWIVRLTKNQKYTILEQLERGAKILDLYVALSTNGVWYCSHTFATIPLQVALDQISVFMETMPTEPIVVLVRPDPEHTSTVVGYEDELIRMLKPIPVSWFYQPMVISLAGTGISNYQSILIDWYDTDSIVDFMDEFNKRKGTTALYGVLTPQGITSKSLKTLAKELKFVLTRALLTTPDNKIPCMLLVDYYDGEVEDSQAMN